MVRKIHGRKRPWYETSGSHWRCRCCTLAIDSLGRAWCVRKAITIIIIIIMISSASPSRLGDRLLAGYQTNTTRERHSDCHHQSLARGHHAPFHRARHYYCIEPSIQLDRLTDGNYYWATDWLTEQLPLISAETPPPQTFLCTIYSLLAQSNSPPCPLSPATYLLTLRTPHRQTTLVSQVCSCLYQELAKYAAGSF